ncbi:hypothetical protein [Gluconobacter potus]|uniref:hypothetical protein n=1 Tax=Gluconobacter potus TaxID=2724927 RepID=UPI0018C86080|nr:hypothetical protein [Gluconobacter potus]
MASKKRSRISRQDPENGKLIKAVESGKTSSDSQKPLFCFEHMVSGYDINECERNEKAQILSALYTRSRMSWSELRTAPRHGLGYEKIARTSINPTVPEVITEDVDIIAFRCIGLAPMIGYKDGNIFRIVWIDREFKVYDH